MLKNSQTCNRLRVKPLSATTHHKKKQRHNKQRNLANKSTFSTHITQSSAQYSHIIKGPVLSTPKIPLVERIISHAHNDPNRHFFRQGNNIYTYGDLLTHSVHIAKLLRNTFSEKFNLPLNNKQKRVCILAPSSFEYSSYNLATWFNNSASVPLFVEHPTVEMLHYLTDSESQILATHPQYIQQATDLLNLYNNTPAEDDKVKQHIELVVLDEFTPHISNKETTFHHNAIDYTTHDSSLLLNPEEIAIPSLNDIMVYIYTSGTTGKPKAVALSHNNILTNIRGMIDQWCWKSDDHILDMLPKHHVHGVVNVLYTAIWAGARLTSLEGKFNARDIWCKYFLHGVDFNNMITFSLKSFENDTLPLNILQKYPILKNKQNYFPHLLPKLPSYKLNDNEVSLPSPTPEALTLFMAVPTIYHKLIESYQKDFLPEEQSKLSLASSQFRLMVSGSMALPTVTLTKWEQLSGHRLLERYGMSEIGMAVTNSYQGERFPGQIGFPFGEVEARVRIKNDEESYDTTDDSVVGELLIKGDSVFDHYYNRPKQTAESFVYIDDNDGRGQTKWFLTGDIAKFDAQNNNCISLLGRNSVDILKVSGFKISALDIERSLLDHPNIANVAVVGLPSQSTGQSIAAIIVPRDASSGGPSVDELVKWGSEKMPKYKLPREVFITDQIPTNAMGKINKKALSKFLMNMPEFRDSKWRL